MCALVSCLFTGAAVGHACCGLLLLPLRQPYYTVPCAWVVACCVVALPASLVLACVCGRVCVPLACPLLLVLVALAVSAA